MQQQLDMHVDDFKRAEGYFVAMQQARAIIESMIANSEGDDLAVSLLKRFQFECNFAAHVLNIISTEPKPPPLHAVKG